MSNFVPNDTKSFVPRDPPWINKPLKSMLNRKNRLYKSYTMHGYREEDKARLDTFRSECQFAVDNAKFSYFNCRPHFSNCVHFPSLLSKPNVQILVIKHGKE